MLTPIRPGDRWRIGNGAYRLVIVQKVKKRVCVVLTLNGIVEISHAVMRQGWRLQPKLDDRYKVQIMKTKKDALDLLCKAFLNIS